MRRQIMIWGTRVVLLALIVYAAYRWGAPLYKQYFTPKKAAVYIPTTKVREGRFVVSFHEIGTLEAERSIAITSRVGGKIIALIADGKVVQAGDVIAQLDTTDLEREVRNQRLNYENALADVRRAESELEILKESNKTEVEQAEAQLKFDETERDRAKEQLKKKERLAADKLVPRDQVDQAELEVRAKELAVTKGSKALDLKRKEVLSKEKQKEADVAKVRFAADISRSSLEDVQNRLKSATIKAPAGGLVVISKDWTPDGRRKLQEGDSVRPQQTICALPDLSSMRVKVQVGESDAPRLRIGIPALIRLEAIPNRLFHGTVDDISSLATEAMPWETGSTPGRKNFEVIIAVKEVDPKTLKPGMTADVEFLCDVVERAVFVPIESVSEREGKTYAFVREGKRYRRVPVTTGRRNDNFVCITKGLRAGQIIALRDPSRPLEEQEAGSAVAGAGEQRISRQAAPMPNSGKQ